MRYVGQEPTIQYLETSNPSKVAFNINYLRTIKGLLNIYEILI